MRKERRSPIGVGVGDADADGYQDVGKKTLALERAKTPFV